MSARPNDPATALPTRAPRPARSRPAVGAVFLLAAVAALVSGGGPARAADLPDRTDPLSLEGFSGHLSVPSAFTVAEGWAAALYSRPHDPRYAERQRTYVLTFGFAPWLEVGGRIAEAISPDGTFTGLSIRDLSAQAKLRLPLELVWPASPLSVAVGTQDEGGGAGRFRTRYGVASLRLAWATASTGYGTGPDRMKGLFGAVELRPAPWLHLVADREGGTSRVGGRVDVPVELFRFPLRIGALGRTTVGGATRTTELGLTFSADLRGRPPPSPLPGLPDVLPAPGQTPLDALQEDLEAAGFEEVRAAVVGDTLVVEVENARFGHSERDGVGAALGIVTRGAPAGPVRFALVLKRAGLRLAELAGPMRALRAAFRRTAPEPAALAALGFSWHPPSRPALEARPRRNGRFLHGQLVLAPFFRTLVAWDYAVVDTVLSIRPEVLEGLWPGATAYARWDIPVAWTKNFSDGGPAAAYRPAPQLDHALLYQAVSPLRGLHALVGAGAFRVTGLGAIGELLWTPGAADGLALGAQGGWVKVEQEPTPRWSALGSARWFDARTDLLVRVRAGQFYEQDRGFSAEVARFFGDTEVGFFYLQTASRMVGVQVTLPLTPRSDMRPGLVQVRGSRRWQNDVQTVVGEPFNVIRGRIAVPPMTPYNLDEAFLDGGRLSGAYLAAEPGHLAEAGAVLGR